MVYKISTEDRSIEWGLKGNDRIVQNMLNILRTRKYEIPFMRDLGIDTDYMDNITSYVCNNLTNDVIELAEQYESRVTILNVNVKENDANGNIIIEVEMEV